MSSADETRARRTDAEAGPMPDAVRQGWSLWRLAVVLYLPVLAASILKPLLGWDGMVSDALDAAAKASETAGPNVPAFTPDQVESTLLTSTVAVVAMQIAVTALTWYLASRLPRRSTIARMALAVLAVVFAVNAILNLLGIGSAGAFDAAVTLVTVAASAVAVWAAVLTFRDSTRRGPWFDQAD